MASSERRELLDEILALNGGALSMNFSKTARVLGRYRSTIPGWLRANGVPYFQSGKEKRVYVHDLAEGILREKSRNRIY